MYPCIYEQNIAFLHKLIYFNFVTSQKDGLDVGKLHDVSMSRLDKLHEMYKTMVGIIINIFLFEVIQLT